jgi:hypothetical protein
LQGNPESLGNLVRASVAIQIRAWADFKPLRLCKVLFVVERKSKSSALKREVRAIDNNLIRI